MKTRRTSSHRRLYESRVLPTELASLACTSNLAGRAGFEPAHGVINSHVPFQLGYRPKNMHKNQKAPTFGRSLRECESELRVLWTDQSRSPSAIDAPSHHGFGLYAHFEAENSIAFGGNPALTPFCCSSYSLSSAPFSVIDLAPSPRSSLT